MTSLVSTPKFELVESKPLHDGGLEESLFTVWRTTRNAKLDFSRLRNRSWRLISERIFNCSQKSLDKSLLTLHDKPLVPHSNSIWPPMLQNRPSLFQNQSKYTRHSILSLQKLAFSDANLEFASGEDSSDISEDELSDDDYVQYEPAQSPRFVKTQRHDAPMNQTIGFASKLESRSALPTTETSTKVDVQPIQAKQACNLNGASRANSKGNIFFISSSVSPRGPKNSESQSCLFNNEPPPTPMHIERKDSLFNNTATMSENSARNVASSLSSTDISEVSDFENQPSSLRKNEVYPIATDAISTKKGRSMKVTEDTESEWMSVSSDSELAPESPSIQPISFVKRIPIPQPVDDNPCQPADDTLRNSPSSFKPRSLLSGLFLSELNNPAIRSPVSTKSANLEHVAPKPVLKRSSTTGVITVDSNSSARGIQRPSILLSKRYVSSSDFTKKVTPHRSPIPSVAEEDPAKEDNSNSDEQRLFTKQTSSVGLSNFLAMADAKNNTQHADLKSDSSHMDQQGTAAGADALSSSLSKYSSWQCESSIKNLFTKSSINLLSLFGHGITGKLRLQSDSTSNETVKSMPLHQPEPVPPVASLFAEHLSQQSLMEPSNSESTLTTSKSVRVEPKVLRDFTPSVEISESLKDSLMIDHKLGKAPLPDRVISHEDLFSGLDKKAFVQDTSDYHSKGW
ncbi:hypothetical protein METBIDRAFT_11142 [Metschnikowia bicuspidata var. bicuspidata NRRL YB-4993]|uniref:Nitrogen regulatory protein areA GATA-like domain-containing protein n=1 Tax=Metschnikowia bicuspidata var. bicuspidata NRRL YB-4993 TaxID=869754 RepID=A0A1A0HE69_9ASCO|nr:hypothetical protein METBIDRAFT_11142 [Metschnikowia bicuspidata var. bicuspidata NRRL YB-4993]OBA22285.1 hypothetical protein METBIDRAFT_11142 [Metschnikowia bicuspidata var. bicuspidata NRRL YB-4993]